MVALKVGFRSGFGGLAGIVRVRIRNWVNIASMKVPTKLEIRLCIDPISFCYTAHTGIPTSTVL